MAAGWVGGRHSGYIQIQYIYIYTYGGKRGGDGGEEHPQNTPAGRRIHTYAGG